MKVYPKIWFLRHGQTEWNKAYRLQGQLDSPLTDQGIREAQQQARIMPDILAQNPTLFASPLGRARQTAEIALASVKFRTDARLMEINAGAWQGRFRNELIVEDPSLFAPDVSALDIYAAAPQGERLDAFHARIVSFLGDLEGPSVIVAHGLLGQVLRAEICGLSLGQAGQMSNRQGCVYVLENGQEHVLETQS